MTCGYAKAHLERGEHWHVPAPAASNNVPALLVQLAALRQQTVLISPNWWSKISPERWMCPGARDYRMNYGSFLIPSPPHPVA